MTRTFLTARRRVLRQLAAVAGTVSLPVPLAAATEASEGEALLRAVDELLPDRASPGAIGEAYLRQAPGERCLPRLSTLLVERAAAAGLPLTAAGLLRRIQLDFEQEDIVKVRGWLLSLTEARLSALCRLRGPVRSPDGSP